MKIAVIFTGGTIGSKLQDGWISANRETKFQLVESYRATDKSSVEFVCFEPYFILSENLSAKELNLLISAFEEAEKSDVDGVIITHGTDSLQFSAAALSLISKNKKPAVLVSANYPLDDPRGNGKENFAAAVDFILQNCGKGVFVSYKNSDGHHYFHRGDRVVAFLEGDDRLYSLGHKPYALWEEGNIKLLGDETTPHSVSISPLVPKPRFLSITASPADSFEYSLDGVNAVLLRPYHSGTLNTANSDFVIFLNKAKDKNIPVFLVNAPIGETYESTKLYDDLGVIPIADVTFAQVFMRLWFAVSGGENLRRIF